MSENRWCNYFIDLLKYLESQGESVHEFRRSFESGGKKDRIYPSLTQIYNKCKDKLENDDFIEWFNGQSFRVKNGLKVITIKCDKDHEIFEHYLRQLFSHWNSEIKYEVPQKEQKPSGISKKKVDKTLKYMKNLNPQQLKNIVALASSSGLNLESLSSNLNIQ